MRHLFASTCLTAIALVPLSSPVRAETSIADKRTAGVSTSTIKAGAADDIRITSAGSVVPTSGVAVRIDSANKVVNEGTIQITNADNASGILANAGMTGGIANSGKIIIDETYTPVDADKDGDLDGPLATGTGRTGIATAGAFTGNIANSGAIAIEGKDSAGIRLSGPLTGTLSTDGSIGVTGDRSVGVATGDVHGNIRLAGTITAQGKDASAATIGGDVQGALVVQGTLSATGYRTVDLPDDVSKLDGDDLLQGGPALAIAGNVSGGVILAVPPTDASTTDTDEDKDGIEDSKEGSAAVTSYGAAAAVQIGAADRDVALGAVAGNGAGFGLVIDGGVAGHGIYKDVDANGLLVGGQGGAVTIAGGIGVAGSVLAVSNGGNATAIRIGSDATVPEIRVSGTVSASGAGSATTHATAISIDAGATVTTIRNAGTIKASASDTTGSATAIVDRAGTVALVENSGTISASGADAASTRNVAIDLSANGAGAIVRQTVVASGVSAPQIIGDIRFGSGADLLDIADGSVTGSTVFGAGDNALKLSGDAAYLGTASFGAGADAMTLSGSGSFAGAADFGGGSDTLTLADTAHFSGTLANAGGLRIAVNGGTLDLAKGVSSIAALSVGNGGVLGITIDGLTKTNTRIDVAGNASFAQGAGVVVRLTSITGAEGRYTIVHAGSIDGAANLTGKDATLPFLYKSSVTAVGSNEIAVDIARKTSGELGLNRSQASAYDAIYNALGTDQQVAGVFLDIADGDSFRKTLRQMLPDHAGGAFEAVTSGSRATARILADPQAPISDQGGWGFWIDQVGFGKSKNLGDTAAYDVSGWGISGGAEIKTGFGSFGGSLGYLYGSDKDGGTANEVSSNQYEAAAYWRLQRGPLQAHVRGSIAQIDFAGERHFDGAIGGVAVSREAKGDWNGRLVSASGAVSYDLRSGRFSLRPILAADYYRLREDGYGETGGGKAFDLIVDKRTSDELAVSGTVAAGINFGGESLDDGWFRAEIEGGRRQLAGGSLGDTTARFDGGTAFTLASDKRRSGWVGRVRGVGGSANFQVGGEVGAEQQEGHAAVSVRASIQIGL